MPCYTCAIDEYSAQIFSGFSASRTGLGMKSLRLPCAVLAGDLMRQFSVAILWQNTAMRRILLMLFLVVPVVAQFTGWPPMPREAMQLLANGNTDAFLAALGASAD